MSGHDPRERLAYRGELGPVFERISEAYNLGDFEEYQVAPVGYEDFNATFMTDKGRHFIKIFSADRSPQDLDRFSRIMSAVLANGVSHPDIYRHNGQLIYTDHVSGLSAAVMEYVGGQTFYDMRRVPDDEELRQIIRQAVLVHAVDFEPPFLYNSWAVQYTRKNYEPIKANISETDKALIEGALEEFEVLDYEKLPHCLVHGDFVKSNVIKSPEGRMYIVDFSVANWYPRIQELAVIIANLLNDEYGNRTYTDNLKQVVRLYIEEGGELAEEEVRALPAYARVAYAAELVGAHRERLESDRPPKENQYWLHLGRIGLERSL